MTRRRIPEYLVDCPQGWRNFIADLRLRIKPNDNNGYSKEIIEQELSKFGAVYEDYDETTSYVVFNDERLHNMFVLKYGVI